MSDIEPFDEEYKQWIADIKQRYQSAQVKAAVSVNSFLLVSGERYRGEGS